MFAVEVSSAAWICQRACANERLSFDEANLAAFRAAGQSKRRARRGMGGFADLEVGDTAGLETCASLDFHGTQLT